MEAALQSTTFASRVCFSSLVPAHFSQSPSGNSARRALSTRKYGSRNPAWQVSPVCLAVSDGVSTVQERTNAQESPSEAPRPDLSSKLGAVVTDAAVPEGHKGLHGFLYGEAGADVHDGEAAFQVRAREDDGSTVVELEHWLQGRENERPPGVYAIYDKSGVLQYIGYSRNLVLTLKQHRQRVGEERTAGVRVKVYTNSALVSRARLEEERQAWVAQQTLPAGNGAERDLWEGTGPATAVMTEAERGAYEEKKLKMRKAMGEGVCVNFVDNACCRSGNFDTLMVWLSWAYCPRLSCLLVQREDYNAIAGVTSCKTVRSLNAVNVPKGSVNWCSPKA